MADNEAVLNVEEPIPASNQRGLSSTLFRDHSSLAAPSSMIRFRSTTMISRVYADPVGQFIIEDDHDDEGRRTVTTKRLETRTAALMGLRCTYTIVNVFLVRRIHCLAGLHRSIKMYLHAFFSHLLTFSCRFSSRNSYFFLLILLKRARLDSFLCLALRSSST